MDTLVDIVEHVLKPLWVVMVTIAFLGIVAWAYRPRNKGRFKSYGDIPFQDGETSSPPDDKFKER